MLHNFPIKYHLAIIVLLWSLIFGLHSYSQSQTYPFKQFPLPQDLPEIREMYEDHQGYIWLGTIEGLYRFDGIHYTFYSGKDQNKNLGREVISTIFEDNQHNLWIGARTGLYKFEKDQKDFQKFSIADDMYPEYVHQESDSSFLVQTYIGIYFFYPKSNRWVKLPVGIDGKNIFAVRRGRQDDLWIGTEHIVRKYNLHDHSVSDIKLSMPSFAKPGEKIMVNNLFLDSRDYLWINTWHKGVIKLDTRSGTIETFDTLRINSGQYLLELFNPSMVEDRAGNIWLASGDSGLNIYNHKNVTISHIAKAKDNFSGLTGNHFLMITDRQKNMWVKSDRALHYLPYNSPVIKLKSNPKVPIEEALFIRLLNLSNALVGTHFGLYHVNLKDGNVDQLNTNLQISSTRNAEFQSTPDVIIDNETMMLASPQGLREVKIKFEGEVPVFSLIKMYPTRANFQPSRLVSLNDSMIVVKGRTNTPTFATFNTLSDNFEYHDFPDSMLINQLIDFKNDTIILCIRNKGMYYYDIHEKSLHNIPWKFEDPVTIQKPVFHKIVLLQNGTYAVCTENYGLLIYNPQRGTFNHIDVAQMSNTNIVFSAEEDKQHNLWVQTASQLLYYDTQSKRLSKVNLSNSFKGQNPNYFMDKGESLYTTFEGGLYWIDIHQLFTKTEKPKLYLEAINAGDRQLDWNNSNQMKLSYADNFLTYEFIGIDYDNPHGITYWYKIPEISDQWITLDNRTSISLGRLSPGKYNFSIKASNDAGLWSEEIQAPELKIRPPFWRSWWFLLGAFIIVMSLAAYFIKLRRLKKQAEMKLRNQIAKDLHDDIGSTLSGIKIFSTIASGMAGENQDLSSLLHQISDKSDTMMQSMSDIVWSINPAYDSLNDIMIRLKQYMSEMLESQNIEVDFKAHTDLKMHKIDLGHRKELFLALKEIVNNAAKHAQCTKLNFDISRQKDDIVFVIKDNGIGMNESNIVFGNGLRNVESRIEQIDGKLLRNSSPGFGTRYEIRVGVM